MRRPGARGWRSPRPRRPRPPTGIARAPPSTARSAPRPGSPPGSPRPPARGRTPPTRRSALAGWAYQTQARCPRITTAAGTAAAVAYVRSDRASTGGYRSRQMRVRLIVNPTATGVRGPVLDAVVAQLERVCELEVAETERAGHGLELAREVDVRRRGRDGRRRHGERGRKRRPAGRPSWASSRPGRRRSSPAIWASRATPSPPAACSRRRSARRARSWSASGSPTSASSRSRPGSGSTPRRRLPSTASGRSARPTSGPATSRLCRRRSASSGRRASRCTSG